MPSDMRITRVGIMRFLLQVELVGLISNEIRALDSPATITDRIEAIGETEMADFDIQIKGGTIVDGTRVPRYRGDVWIKDGKVAQSADARRASPRR